MFFVNTTIIALWFFSIIIDYGEFLYFWQLKEYRFDRFKDFLSTTQGNDFIKSYPIFFRSLFILILLIFINIIFLKNIVFLIFIIELFRIFSKIVKKKLKRPKITLKSAIIFCLVIITEIIIFYLIKDFLILLVFLVFRFFFISIVVGLLSFPTFIIKYIYIKQATKKINIIKKMTVIGITGSYGKTTVKNFLYQILNSEKKVIKTPKNINTEIGVAKFILKTDFSGVDIFIVEMGAYNMGEIKLICDMVSPKIGILTSINEQHLSLFCDIKNTQIAKYELLRSLPENGLAIVNNDNHYCLEYLKELECEVQTFGIKPEFNPTYLIKNINTDNKELIFDLIIKNKTINKIVSHIIGEHNIMNITPCIMVGLYLGIKDNVLLNQVKNLTTDKLKFYNYGQSIIIDDSYNSNPNGFEVALKILCDNSSERKKIVITRGMLELGDKSDELHQKIGKIISNCSDELVLISPDFKKPILEGTKSVVVGDSKLQIKTIYNNKELLSYFKELKNNKNIILLENKIFDNILQEYKK